MADEPIARSIEEPVSGAPVSPTASKPGKTQNAPSGRLMSLDVFRGLTIAGMLVVNDPGSWTAVYEPLDHAEWNGWTPTDMVFPFFLFIVGVAMVLSFKARLARGADRWSLMKHSLIRGALIYAIGFGLVLIWHWDLHTIRIPGVLARIGVVYAIAAFVYLYLPKRGRLAWIVVSLVGYWLAMRFIPVPGYGAGNFWDGAHREANLEAYIDRMFLTGHMWSERHQLWDPEGILSTIPAVCTTLLGNFVGEWFAKEMPWQERIKKMALWGAVWLAAGRALHPIFPINKNIWTSTFVLFMAGWATLVLALCYWMVDVKKWRGWTPPFVWFGMNAILAYCLSWIGENIFGRIHATLPDGKGTSAQGWFFQVVLAPHFGDPRNASLIYALLWTTMWCLVMWVFYRKKIFLKV